MNKYRFFSFIFFSLIFFYLYINASDNFDRNILFWGSFNYWLFSFPLILYSINYKNSKINFPFIEILGLTLLISYGIPPFLIDSNSYQLYPLTIDSLKLSFWFYFLFFITYYLFNYLLSGISPYKLIKQFNVSGVKRITYIFFIIYVIGKFISNSLLHLSDLSLYLFIGFYFILFNKKIKIPVFLNVLFYLVLFYEILMRLTSGLASSLIFFSLFVFIIDYLINHNLKRIFVPLVLLIFIYTLFAAIKSEYRAAVWGSEINLSTSQKLITLNELTFDDENVKSLGSSDKGDKESFFWRFSYQASAFSLVLANTPSIVPYWGGESYKFFSKFIPRFIWPDKPEENLGQEFGHRYNVLDFFDFGTSMNTPILAEAYMNFGLLGAGVFMSILGGLYAFFNRKFNSKNASLINVIIGVAILFPLTIHESNFTLIFGNIPLKLISLYILANFFYFE